MKNIIIVLLILLRLGISDALSPIDEAMELMGESGPSGYNERHVCEGEANDFRQCLLLTYNDYDACVDCVYSGQSNPDYFSCEEMDCLKIDHCRDTYCNACESEFMAFSNCAFIEGCAGVHCVTPEEACYDETAAANGCADSL